MQKDPVRELSEKLTDLYVKLERTSPSDSQRLILYPEAVRIIRLLPKNKGRKILERMFEKYQPDKPYLRHSL